MEIIAVGKRTFTKEEKRAVVERYKGSGVKQDEFCQREGISLSALQNWKRRYGGVARGKFVELPVKRAAVNMSIELELPYGIRLKLRS